MSETPIDLGFLPLPAGVQRDIALAAAISRALEMTAGRHRPRSYQVNLIMEIVGRLLAELDGEISALRGAAQADLDMRNRLQGHLDSVRARLPVIRHALEFTEGHGEARADCREALSVLDEVWPF